MANKSLVIVESPTKAKTIKKFLPKNFIVEASMGHIRDLPQSATEIPAKLKKEEWAKIGVNVDNDFEPLYVIPKGKFKVVAELKKIIKEVDEIYLATDEDREGESISWHLLEVLKPKIPVKRMVFHEITKPAIERALKESRKVDEKLVRAQETRRILDRLVGYTLSPLIWKKISFGLSAGRVQSVGLRLISERERERIRFKKAEYWDLEATLFNSKDSFLAKLVAVDDKKIATGKDFDENTGLLKTSQALLLNKDQALELAKKLKTKQWSVVEVEEKPFSSKPSAPFITSTLQQESNRKLGLSSRDTMRSAQKLYEEGLITYMRTDSTSLSQEAIKAARDCVVDLYGKDYLSEDVRIFTTKSKGAQEAHEAIRPAGAEFVHPKDTGLSGKELALYELIWKRTVATQMAEAKKLSMVAKIKCDNSLFQASGTRILFPGFLRAYVEGSDDPEAALEDKESALPEIKKGQLCQVQELKPLEHETKPPARFTEASLVQKLEKEGIGRPSTYASIISTIMDRGYVRKVANALVPTFTGLAVSQLLENNFEELVDLGFTSKMEEALDEIASGELDWLPYLKKFYLGKNGLREKVKTQDKVIDPETSRQVQLPNIKGVQIRIGRYGPYVVQKQKAKGAEDLHASIPESIAPADLNETNIQELIELSERGPESIGKDPATGLDVFCLVGRYGPYVQLGLASDDKPKPKRASLLKGMDPKTITMPEALKLLSLPRELGQHPVTHKPIVANQGRFGAYVMHDGDFRSLKKDDDLFTVTLSRALELLAEEKKGRGGSTVLKDFGKHPDDNKTIALYNGKYGPYIKHGAKNFKIPEGSDPATLDLNQALNIVGAAPKKGASKKARKRA